MSSQPEQQYWDSCIFLCALNDREDERDKVAAIAELLRKADDGEIIVVVSTLVLAEVRPRETYNITQRRLIDDLFYRGRSNVRVISVTPAIAAKASDIGGLHNAITVPDAIHVATAALERVSVMYTLDGNRDNEKRRSGKLLEYDGRIGVPRLAIKPPPPPRQSTMFDLLGGASGLGDEFSQLAASE